MIYKRINTWVKKKGVYGELTGKANGGIVFDLNHDKAVEQMLEEWSMVKDYFVCDCTKNYGKACKHPDRYREGGCK